MQFNELQVEAIIINELMNSDLKITDCDGSIDTEWTREAIEATTTDIIQKLKQLND